MKKKIILIIVALTALLVTLSACACENDTLHIGIRDPEFEYPEDDIEEQGTRDENDTEEDPGSLSAFDIDGVYEGTATYTKIVYEEDFDLEFVQSIGEKIYEVGDSVHALCYVEAITKKLVKLGFIFDYDEDFDKEEDMIYASYDILTSEITFSFGDAVDILLIASEKDGTITLEGYEKIDMGEAWGAKDVDLKLVKIDE